MSSFIFKVVYLMTECLQQYISELTIKADLIPQADLLREQTACEGGGQVVIMCINQQLLQKGNGANKKQVAEVVSIH
jgi:hypothetical protein